MVAEIIGIVVGIATIFYTVWLVVDTERYAAQCMESDELEEYFHEWDFLKG